MSEADSNSRDSYWSGLVSRYLAVPPPLRPQSAEFEQYFRLAASCLDGVTQGQFGSVLVLGATPEFYHHFKKNSHSVMALDKSQAMLETLWPGAESEYVVGDWVEAKLGGPLFDLALCDGGLSLLEYPGELQRFAQVMCKRLAPGGLLVSRVFLPERTCTALEQVLDDLHQGEVCSASLLKVRLWMALAAKSDGCVTLHDVWSAYDNAVECKDTLRDVAGWGDADFDSMASYQGLHTNYFFPDENALKSGFQELAGFSSIQFEQSAAYPDLPIKLMVASR